MMEARTITIGERIVIHLSQFARNQDAFVCPPGMAQSGIADSLGISRAHAAIELRRQMDAGRIAVRVAHVTGAPTRRKVYRLTPKGEMIARAVRARAFGHAVELVHPDGRRERLIGHQALHLLRRHGISEGRSVLLLLTQPRIDLRQPGIRRTVAPPRGTAQAPEIRARVAFDRVFYQPIAWQFAVTLGPPHAPPVPAAA